MLKISQLDPFPDNNPETGDPAMLPGNLPSNDVEHGETRSALERLRTEVSYMLDKIDAVLNGDIEAYELDMEYLKSNAKDILRRVEQIEQVERPINYEAQRQIDWSPLLD